MNSLSSDWEAFRIEAESVADWIATYRSTLEQLPVLSRVEPGECADQIPPEPPDAAEPLASVLADLDDIIVPGLTHWNHPGFHAYFNTSSTPAGILGDFAAAAINAQAMLWRTSPAATELEIRMMEWLCHFVGLPDCFTGVIQDTASTSTFTALIAARERALPGVRTSGLVALGTAGRPTLYMSEHAHSSVDKCAIAAGLGLDGLCRIPVATDYGMDPEALESALARAAAEGRLPVMVCATIGTTSMASIDPPARIADVCERFGVWLHVDAAYAGPAAALPEKRALFGGWERADSIVINPHKWMMTPMDCSALLFRDPDAFRLSLALTPEYLTSDTDAINLMDYGLALGRRFRALKLWFVFRRVGADGLRTALREHIALARTFAGWLEDDPAFEVVAPVHFGLVCFRSRPPVDARWDANEWNRRLMECVNIRGRVFLSHTVIDDRYVIRCSVGGIGATERGIRQTYEELAAAHRDLREGATEVPSI
jgi:aromatic-L-amino-acid decarboxylase